MVVNPLAVVLVVGFDARVGVRGECKWVDRFVFEDSACAVVVLGREIELGEAILTPQLAPGVLDDQVIDTAFRTISDR